MLKRGAFIVLVSVLGLGYGLFPEVQRIASYICYPFICLQYKLIDPIKVTQSSALVIQEAYEQLLSDYVRLQAAIDFQSDTKELRAFKQRYETDQAVLAQILERYLGTEEQYLLIDKGAQHGIKEHMVLVYKDMLVGRVHQVFPLYSRCILVTDQRCKVAAYCAQTKVRGITKGINQAGCIELNHVHYLCEVQEGDLLISSGDGLIFPRGFGIAKVTELQKDGLTYHVMGKPLIDWNTVNYCYVLTTCHTINC